MDTYKAFEFVKQAFGATRVELRELSRGILSEAEIRAAEGYSATARAA